MSTMILCIGKCSNNLFIIIIRLIHNSGKWVKVNGVLIKPKGVVVKSIDDCEQPSFGEVEDIFVDCSTVLLVLRELQSIEYDSHFHSWAVRRTDITVLMNFKDLASTQVLILRHARHNNDLLFHITLKYAP